ncbi:hypothetical protein [Streptomyces sp. NPDC059639]|uniref:hypothetical protein n=1 Tax=Streptomyces sp. NPDC059639 TaxID=3346891 RepID=UPI0036C7F731
MSASVSALVVAVVGVLGTLVSGLLAHRSASRAKQLELRHADDQRRADQERNELQEMMAARRTSYARLNQAVRHFHAVLTNHRSRTTPLSAEQQVEMEDARRSLRDAYAESQMIASDDVLGPAGKLVNDLYRTHVLIKELGQDGPTAWPRRIDDLLMHSAESLYGLRQRMRKDLGITDLPIDRHPSDDEALLSPLPPHVARRRIHYGGGGTPP